MRERETVMYRYIILSILILIIIILAVRLGQYKRQIHLFTKIIRERKDMKSNQMVTVEYFNADIVALANILNEYTMMQKPLALQYEEDRKQLKNVIAGISHDFRTPLTAIKGYLQLLQKNADLNANDMEHLNIALEKTQYLKNLSDSFFELSSLEAKEDVELTSVHFNNLLSEHILEQYSWMEKSNIEPVLDISEKDILVQGNEHLLNRILDNFFSNLHKYAKSYVKIYLQEEQNNVVFYIENDVAGTDKVDVEHVFEPFYREHARHQEGSGLGLYVVKCLAQQMGYQISAHYKEAVFKVTLTAKKKK